MKKPITIFGLFLSVFLLLISCVSNRDWLSSQNYQNSNGSSSRHTPIDNFAPASHLPDLEKKVATLGIALHPRFDSADTRKTLAVLAFNSETASEVFIQNVQDILHEVFFQLGILKLYERDQLQKVLTEQSFQLSGFIDDSSAKKLGALIGVDLICYGTITELHDQIRIAGKIADITSGEIITVSSVLIDKDLRVQSLYSKASAASSAPAAMSQNPIGSSQNTFQANISWQVEIHRNSFDGYSVFTISVGSASGALLYLGYVRHDDPFKSYVRVGTNLDGYSDVEIRTEDGSIKKYPYFSPGIWHYQTGLGPANGKYIYGIFSSNSHRIWLETLLANNTLTLRRGNIVARFNTFGLQQVLAKHGISMQEIDNALSNEEF